MIHLVIILWNKRPNLLYLGLEPSRFLEHLNTEPLCDYTPDAVKQRENSDTFKKKLIRFGQALGRRGFRAEATKDINQWAYVQMEWFKQTKQEKGYQQSMSIGSNNKTVHYHSDFVKSWKLQQINYPSPAGFSWHHDFPFWSLLNIVWCFFFSF